MLSFWAQFLHFEKKVGLWHHYIWNILAGFLTLSSSLEVEISVYRVNLCHFTQVFRYTSNVDRLNTPVFT
jgi:hypothetical protein